MGTPASRRESLAVAAAVGLCATAFAYAAFRVLQAAFYPSPDPRTVGHVTRIAFYWRALLSVFVGLMAILGTLSLRERSPVRFDRLLPHLVIVTVVAVVGQSLLLP